MIQGEEFKSLVEPGSLNFIFGGNGFFGYSFVQSSTPAPKQTDTTQLEVAPTDTVMWWSTYEMKSCPDPKSVDPDVILRDLRARLNGWKDPMIQKILSTVKVQTIYPVYTTPELPTWYRYGVILIGDAAHTLSPTTGQGTCQALEDVECFSMLLAHSLKERYGAVQTATTMDTTSTDGLPNLLAQTERQAIADVMQTHMQVRKPRIHAIHERAKRFDSSKKNISVVTEFLMYFGLFIMGKFPVVSRLPYSPLFELLMTNKVISHGRQTSHSFMDDRSLEIRHCRRSRT